MPSVIHIMRYVYYIFLFTLNKILLIRKNSQVYFVEIENTDAIRLFFFFFNIEYGILYIKFL
ncbi:hypothetical protein EDC94DRAFT_619923 [Helicostylum pulchrum]|nr:hypothetical protein EDC94DRAFT_619923 [Helicostylum pulchrum]